jgi:adenylate cyclase
VQRAVPGLIRPSSCWCAVLVAEIERKFRVERVPDALGAGVPLRQAYLALDGDVELRVRSQGEAHVLTVKGGRGIERTEIELAIDEQQFDELWALAGDRHLEKTRYRVPVGDASAELDLYRGRLSGLAVVEVEFRSREQADAFVPPPWFGDELTGRPGWSNAELAVAGEPPATRRPARGHQARRPGPAGAQDES